MEKLTPKTAAPPPGVNWATGSCNLCGKDVPVVLDLAPGADRRDVGEEGCVYACPECSERVVGLILTAYAEWRWELAAVVHYIWGHLTEPLTPLLERLAANLRAALGARDGNDSWTREMLDALHKDELAVRRWKAKVMAGFVDLHDVERSEYHEQADKILAALGVELEPKEVEFRSVEGREDVFTSGRVKVEGSHERVSVWNRGGLAGELVVTQGDGEELLLRLGMERKSSICSPSPEEMGREWAQDFLQAEKESLKKLRRMYHERAGWTGMAPATREYILALEDYVKRSIPDLDKE